MMATWKNAVVWKNRRGTWSWAFTDLGAPHGRSVWRWLAEIRVRQLSRYAKITRI